MKTKRIGAILAGVLVISALAVLPLVVVAGSADFTLWVTNNMSRFSIEQIVFTLWAAGYSAVVITAVAKALWALGPVGIVASLVLIGGFAL